MIIKENMTISDDVVGDIQIVGDNISVDILGDVVGNIETKGKNIAVNVEGDVVGEIIGSAEFNIKGDVVNPPACF